MLLAQESLIFLSDMIYFTVFFFSLEKETQASLEASNHWHVTHGLFLIQGIPFPITFNLTRATCCPHF